MRLVRIKWFSDFIEVLNSTWKCPTKNDYFPMHILFTIFYLLQDQKLNPRNYYE
jgi:hypothetical protein